MTPPPEHLVRTDTELADLWTELMGDEPFGLSTLWIIAIGADGVVAPIILPVDELPPRPDGNLDLIVEEFGRLLGDVGGSIAFLLSRPGPSTFTDDDRAWAHALRSLDDPRLTRWPVHLATHGRVRVFAPDDLLRSA